MAAATAAVAPPLPSPPPPSRPCRYYAVKRWISDDCDHDFGKMSPSLGTSSFRPACVLGSLDDCRRHVAGADGAVWRGFDDPLEAVEFAFGRRIWGGDGGCDDGVDEGGSSASAAAAAIAVAKKAGDEDDEDEMPLSVLAKLSSGGGGGGGDDDEDVSGLTTYEVKNRGTKVAACAKRKAGRARKEMAANSGADEAEDASANDTTKQRGRPRTKKAAAGAGAGAEGRIKGGSARKRGRPRKIKPTSDDGEEDEERCAAASQGEGGGSSTGKRGRRRKRDPASSADHEKKEDDKSPPLLAKGKDEGGKGGSGRKRGRPRKMNPTSGDGDVEEEEEESLLPLAKTENNEGGKGRSAGRRKPGQPKKLLRPLEPEPTAEERMEEEAQWERMFALLVDKMERRRPAAWEEGGREDADGSSPGKDDGDGGGMDRGGEDDEDGADEEGWDEELLRWAVEQRRQYRSWSYAKGRSSYGGSDVAPSRRSIMTEVRVERLRSVGFDFKYVTWEDRCEELVKFKQEHGTADVPCTTPVIGRWLQWQRKLMDLFREGKPSAITQERYDRLRELGVRTKQEREEIAGEDAERWWDRMYDELLAYKAEHGDCNVPIGSSSLTELAKWVVKQRQGYKDLRAGLSRSKKGGSTLTPVRLQRLHDVGFAFRLKNPGVPWETRLEQCRQFIAEHGHLRIGKSHPVLGTWSGNLRAQYSRFLRGMPTGGLTAERISQLESLGFVWLVGTRPDPERIAPRRTWEERFEELLEFKREHGHVVVPQHYPSLGSWVHGQRREFKRMKEGKRSALTTEKVMKLVEVGFVFDAMYRRGGKLSENFRKLGGSAAKAGL